MLSLLALGGCKTMSSNEYNKLQSEVALSSKLAAENTKLKEQRQVYAALNDALKHEVDEKEVLIEQLTNRTIKVTMQNAVLFDSGEFSLNANGKQILDKIVPSLKEQGDERVVRIIGHTDNVSVHVPNKLFVDNWDLSARRAAEVVRYFIWAHQLPANMFRVEGRSFLEPVDSNDTPEGRAKNRRIEILIE